MFWQNTFLDACYDPYNVDVLRNHCVNRKYSFWGVFVTKMNIFIKVSDGRAEQPAMARAQNFVLGIYGFSNESARRATSQYLKNKPQRPTSPF